MGVAALVLGIVSLVVGFIPLCGFFAIIPAGIGLILGLVDVALKSKTKKPKGQGIAGIVLNGVAILVIILWLSVFAAGAAGAREGLEKASLELQKSSIEMQKAVDQAKKQQ